MNRISPNARKHEILVTGVRLVRRHRGFGKVTVVAIATELDISPRTVRHYCGNLGNLWELIAKKSEEMGATDVQRYAALLNII